MMNKTGLGLTSVDEHAPVPATATQMLHAYEAVASELAHGVMNDWNDPLEYSVGIGVRLRLPMLMIGLDVAQALSEPGKRPRIHLNISQVF
jgi:hypothetical protein